LTTTVRDDDNPLHLFFFELHHCRGGKGEGWGGGIWMQWWRLVVVGEGNGSSGIIQYYFVIIICAFFSP
jgi:hypothetical protein